MQRFITYDSLQYPEMFFLPSSFLCFQRMTNFCKINVSYSDCFGGGWDSKANANTRNGNFRNIVEDIKLTPRTLSDISTSFHVMIYFRGITSSRLGCSYIIPWPSCVFFSVLIVICCFSCCCWRMEMVMVMGEVYLILFLNLIVVMYSKTSAYFRTFLFFFPENSAC